MEGKGVVVRRALIFAAIVSLQTTVAFSEEASRATSIAPGRTLKVGVVDIAPFAIAQADGSWSGLGIDLWTEVATRLELRWEPKEVKPAEVNALLRSHALDLAIGAIAITAEGERDHDYSQSYLMTGLGIAERSHASLSVVSALELFENTDFLKSVTLFFGSLLFVGLLIALVERLQNPAASGGPLRSGVAKGMYWAAAAMTTLGDSDTTPKSRYGRAIALVWMFVGVTAIAYFTATISALLTVGSLHESVRHPSDLFHMTLGAVADSAGAEYLDGRHLQHATFASYEEELAALADKKVDAVVGSIPVLHHMTAKKWQGVLNVSPLVLEPIAYAIALPNESALREPINREILSVIESDAWEGVEARYFGRR